MTAINYPAIIADALTRKCGVCNAPPGQVCHSVIDNQPLPNRAIHWFRADRAGAKRRRR